MMIDDLRELRTEHSYLLNECWMYHPLLGSCYDLFSPINILFSLCVSLEARQCLRIPAWAPLDSSGWQRKKSYVFVKILFDKRLVYRNLQLRVVFVRQEVNRIWVVCVHKANRANGRVQLVVNDRKKRKVERWVRAIDQEQLNNPPRNLRSNHRHRILFVIWYALFFYWYLSFLPSLRNRRRAFVIILQLRLVSLFSLPLSNCL